MLLRLKVLHEAATKIGCLPSNTQYRNSKYEVDLFMYTQHHSVLFFIVQTAAYTILLHNQMLTT